MPKLITVAGWAASAMVLSPAMALAHAGHDTGGAFLNGFAHPIGGLDHVVAMVMAGVLAFQLGGRALWLVPLAFLLAMMTGWGLGAGSVAVPFVELGIAISALAFGAVVASGGRVPAAGAIMLAGLFAIFHGHAHGVEMPDGSGPGYAAGFVLATALLHGAGIGLCRAIGWLGETTAPVATRALGVGACCVGLVFLSPL